MTFRISRTEHPQLWVLAYRVAVRKSLAPVPYQLMGMTDYTHPVALQAIGKKPGDRVRTIDELELLRANEAAMDLALKTIERARGQSDEVV
jgi:hypothetical protein